MATWCLLTPRRATRLATPSSSGGFGRHWATCPLAAAGHHSRELCCALSHPVKCMRSLRALPLQLCVRPGGAHRACLQVCAQPGEGNPAAGQLLGEGSKPPACNPCTSVAHQHASLDYRWTLCAPRWAFPPATSCTSQVTAASWSRVLPAVRLVHLAPTLSACRWRFRRVCTPPCQAGLASRFSLLSADSNHPYTTAEASNPDKYKLAVSTAHCGAKARQGRCVRGQPLQVLPSASKLLGMAAAAAGLTRCLQLTIHLPTARLLSRCTPPTANGTTAGEMQLRSRKAGLRSRAAMFATLGCPQHH